MLLPVSLWAQQGAVLFQQRHHLSACFNIAFQVFTGSSESINKVSGTSVALSSLWSREYISHTAEPLVGVCGSCFSLILLPHFVCLFIVIVVVVVGFPKPCQ